MKMTEQEKKMVKIIQSKKINTFSLKTLDNMENTLKNNQDNLILQSETISKSMDERLKKYDGYAVNELNENLKQIKIEYEENKEELEKINNLQQNRILNDNLIKKLGSEKALNIKQGFIMFLITFVLGLLYYDLTHPQLADSTRKIFFWIDFICCIFFLGNFYFEYRLADKKSWYWKTHILDFITSIPLPDAQVLRLGRTFRLVRLTRLFRFARVLRIFRFLLFFSRGFNELAEIFNIRLMKKSFIYSIAFLLIGAFAINYYEGNSTNEISTIFDSIWWSVNTVVTGGYSDVYSPESALGRILTVILIIAGMILVGIFTATLTSVLLGGEDDDLNNLRREINDRLDKIEEKIK